MSSMPIFNDACNLSLTTQQALALDRETLNTITPPPIAMTPEIERLVALNAPVAYGSSGGKDGTAAAFAFDEYLNSVGHSGQRVVVHSDLGSLEWKDSRPSCERLARALNLDMVVVKPLRGMLERWQYRWGCNIERYVNLNCVKLIQPWSSSQWRFCTSDKFAAITRFLANYFPGQTIISVSGIRRQESPDRAKAPVHNYDDKFNRAAARDGSHGITRGVSYRPIIDWLVQHVIAKLHQKQFVFHNGYSHYGMDRVSCFFCVLSSLAGLMSSLSNPDHHDVYRALCGLEAKSSFSFQSRRWLSDLDNSGILDAETKAMVAEAKEKAALRERIESTIPDHLFYCQHWPKVIPTPKEAELLARVRTTVAGLIGIPILYNDPASIIARYEELMELKMKRQAKNRGKKVPGGACDSTNQESAGTTIQHTLW